MHMQVSQLLAEHPCLVSRGITVYAACPGSCATDMNPHGRHTTAAGAATPAWLVTHEQPEQLSGRFWMWRQQMSFWVFFCNTIRFGVCCRGNLPFWVSQSDYNQWQMQYML